MKKKIFVSIIVFLIVLSFVISMLYGIIPVSRAKAKEKLPEERINELIKAKKPFMIDFYADWCPPCQAMKPILEKLEEKYKGKVEIVRVNVDAPENRALVIKYRIVSIPTFILFNSKGEMSKKIIGYREMEVMENEFKKLLQQSKSGK